MPSWRNHLQFRRGSLIQRIACKSLWLSLRLSASVSGFRLSPTIGFAAANVFRSRPQRIAATAKIGPRAAVAFWLNGNPKATSPLLGPGWDRPTPLHPHRYTGPAGCPAAQLALGLLCASFLRAGHRTSFCLLRPGTPVWLCGLDCLAWVLRMCV